MTTTDPGRERFHAIAGDMWQAFRWVRDRDPIGGTREEQIAQLRDEVNARELVSRYAYSHDSKQVDWTTSLFAPDGVMGHRDGSNRQSEGAAALAERFQRLNTSNKWSRHRMTNFIVRIMPGGQEAWLTAYFHVARISQESQVESQYGRYLGRLVKDGAGMWQFGDWRASVDFVQLYGSEDDIDAAGLRVREPEEPPPLARSATLAKNPPFDGGRATWHELRDDVWNAHHWLLDQTPRPLTTDEKLERLVDEVQIREVLSNYAYAHDSRDLAWSASCFTDDAILINESNVFDGNARVVEAFRGWNRNMVLSFHRFSNPIFRFVPGQPEAWFMAYFHVSSARDERRQYGLGRYFGRFSKHSGRWQIADWRISNDARLYVKPAASRQPAAT